MPPLNISYFRILTIAIGCVVGYTLLFCQDSVGEKPRYTFGVVPQYEPQTIYKAWKPLLTYLEETLDIEIELQGSPDIPTFEAMYFDGKYDFAYVNPWHAVHAYETLGYLPLLRDSKRSLFGIVVVSSNSAIRSINELNGKIMAFPAPNALAATLMVKSELSEIGLEFTEVYTQTHSSSYLNVIYGTADAGTGVKGTFEAQDPKIKSQLRVIYETKHIKPHPITVRPNILTPDNRDRFIQAVRDFAGSEIGRQSMELIPMSSPVNAEIAEYDEVKALHIERYISESQSPNK